MEVSALKPTALAGIRGPSPLLRLQSDERLIALVRRGQHAAFEALFSRYQSRLLAFCRHMLSSKEDAEDVLQEVFTAAFNAILADDREINVRPWLYRIARNRSLNHLRRASAIGVDSMDVHFAENGISTGEKVMRRESFRQLIADVQELPETQRTALLLREIDALSYEQIAEAMETTIPSVKSLLVRARISLAEAAEARNLSCEDVRLQLGEAAEGISKLTAPARRHMRSCERCKSFRKQLKANNVALAAVMPVGALLVLKKLMASKLSAGAHVAGGAGAGAGAGAAASGGTVGGIATAGAGAIASKAVAGLAAAALVTAGAVEAEHAASVHHSPPPHQVAAAPAPPPTPAEPTIVRTIPQPTSIARSVGYRHRVHAKHLASLAAKHGRHATKPTSAASNQAKGSGSEEAAREALSLAKTSSTAAKEPVAEATGASTTSATGAPPVTEVLTETTQLPGGEGSQGAQPPIPAQPSGGETTGSAEQGASTTSTTTTTTTTTESTGSTGSTTTTTATPGVTGGTPAPSAGKTQTSATQTGSASSSSSSLSTTATAGTAGTAGAQAAQPRSE